MTRVRSLILVAAAVFGGLAAAPAALAAPAPAPVDYVALGDSYSSGTGIGSYDPASGNCRRSSWAYPALWKAAHEVSSFQHVACSGATTQDVRNNQLGALSAGTDLVTITAGGNDAGFAEVIRSCFFPASDSQCDSAVRGGERFVKNQLPARLDGLYSAIKAKSPQAKVVVVGYPRLFEPESCLFSFNEYKRGRMNQGADRLNTVIAERARAAGFRFADPRSRFAGHGVCADEPWINQFDASDPVESYHPDATGHARGYLPALTAVTG